MKKERKKAEKMEKKKKKLEAEERKNELMNKEGNGRCSAPKPLKLKIKTLLNDKNHTLQSNGHTTPEIINLDDDTDSLSSVGGLHAGPPSTKKRKTRVSNESKDIRVSCDKCSEAGTNKNLVRCDECKKCYHFSCLIPPLKKSPKVAGYGWHCFDCDPSDQDSDWHLD